jgi:hypothetical protein
MALSLKKSTDSTAPVSPLFVEQLLFSPSEKNAELQNSSSYHLNDSLPNPLKAIERGIRSPETTVKQGVAERTKSFLKGFLWEGPKEMVRGLLDLTPLKPLIQGFTRDLTDPGLTQKMLKTPEGRKKLAYDQLMMIPGMKGLEEVSAIILNSMKSWEGLKSHYQKAWQTDEGKGKIAFDVVSNLLPFTKLEEFEKFAKIGTFQEIPLGAGDILELKNFGSKSVEGMNKMGIKEAEAGLYIKGSSVTGVNFRTGKPFDVGRVSDWDISIVSPTLLKRIEKAGVKLRSGGRRTPSLDLTKKWPRKYIKKAGLAPLAKELSEMMGRNVTFMVYDSLETLASRGEYLSIPKNKIIRSLRK